jgi:hypothetical protein
MKEKKRIEKQTGGQGPSIFDGALDLTVNQNVNISSGPYSEDLPVAGSTVGEIRQKFSEQFDIDAKAQSIVNGNVVGDDVVLKAGESLMFVRHAGEKGATILLENDVAMWSEGDKSESMKLSTLAQRMGPGLSTGNSVIPHGVRAILSQGNQTLMVWERPPHVASLSWIASDSPKPFGPGTTYRQVRISLPYLIIVASFTRGSGGYEPELNVSANECFFRNEPLRSLDDELLYPALLNCSVMKGSGDPLAWICTQYLENKAKLADPFANGLEAVRYCLLETSFNLSSEHHEGNSWFGASRKSIPQIETVDKWEKSTNKDPLFATGVPWLPTKHSVKDFAARTFKRLGAADTGVKTAGDVARIILNG